MLSEGRGPKVVYSSASGVENFLLLIGGLAVVFYGPICRRCADIMHAFQPLRSSGMLHPLVIKNINYVCSQPLALPLDQSQLSIC